MFKSESRVSLQWWFSKKEATSTTSKVECLGNTCTICKKTSRFTAKNIKFVLLVEAKTNCWVQPGYEGTWSINTSSPEVKNGPSWVSLEHVLAAFYMIEGANAEWKWLMSLHGENEGYKLSRLTRQAVWRWGKDPNAGRGCDESELSGEHNRSGDDICRN